MADYGSMLDKQFSDADELKKRHFNGETIDPLDPFPNSSEIHAGKLISLLVKKSTRSLDILAMHLGLRTHSAVRLRDQVRKHPELRVRILVQGDVTGPIYPTGHIDCDKLKESALAELILNPGDTDYAMLARDGNAAQGRIAIRVLPVTSDVHFVVSDGVAYRLETDHETAEGTGNVMDPAVAGKLTEKFDAFWNLSAPAILPTLRRAAA